MHVQGRSYRLLFLDVLYLIVNQGKTFVLFLLLGPRVRPSI